MNRIIRFFNYIFSRIIIFCFSKKKNTGQAIMFMPHSGFSINDLSDLFNYQSDSAMTFAHYLLENNLQAEKEFILFVPSEKYIEKSCKKAQELFPGVKFKFLSWDNYYYDYNDLKCFRKVLQFCRCVNKSSHIFVSITYRLEKYLSNQVVVDLNYYPAPFKNDLLSKASKYYMDFSKVGQGYTNMLFTSELAIRMVMPTMLHSRGFYLDFGLCRNDNLYVSDDCKAIREEITGLLSYCVNKIVLYTPTHRDYEESTDDASRSIFGFSFDLRQFDEVLKKEGIVIICKLHPKQNTNVLLKELPESILIHQANERYGLTELMKASDCMIADYSSGYFDYLVLNKPVIFNWYDLDRYINERGLSYNPVDSIAAGQIVTNKEELLDALCHIETNMIRWETKRKFVRDLFFTYQDGNTCDRVYKHFLKTNGTL